MATVKEKQLQAKIDEEKWVASELAGRDLCGEQKYCEFCDKEAEYPCGKAMVAMQKKEKAEKAEKAAAKKPAEKTTRCCKKTAAKKA